MTATGYVSARRKRKTKANVFGLIGAGVVVIALAALASWYWIAASSKVELDHSTLCPVNDPPTGFHAVLVDTTDALNSVQRHVIERELQAYRRNDVGVHERFSLYAVDETPGSKIDPLFVRCNPGKGEGLSIWAKNPRLLQQRWEREFDAPLAETLEGLLEKKSATSSPIMQMIQVVSVSAFPGRGLGNSKAPYEDCGYTEKRLIIISDLLENTPDYTHYGSKPPRFSDFVDSAQYGKVHTNLFDVDVYVFYVKRHEPAARAVQGTAHMRFWEAYLEAMSARLCEVVPVPG